MTTSARAAALPYRSGLFAGQNNMAGPWRRVTRAPTLSAYVRTSRCPRPAASETPVFQAPRCWRRGCRRRTSDGELDLAEPEIGHGGLLGELPDRQAHQ